MAKSQDGIGPRAARRPGGFDDSQMPRRGPSRNGQTSVAAGTGSLWAVLARAGHA